MFWMEMVTPEKISVTNQERKTFNSVENLSLEMHTTIESYRFHLWKFIGKYFISKYQMPHGLS